MCSREIELLNRSSKPSFLKTAPKEESSKSDGDLKQNNKEKAQEEIEREERDNKNKNSGIECQLTEQELLSVNIQFLVFFLTTKSIPE